MIVEGYVEILGCPNCEATHPHFTFSGDTDMTTTGFAYAGDRDGRYITLFCQSESQHSLAEGRDLRSAEIAQVNDQTIPIAGETFPAFLQRFQPPELVFQCPWCGVNAMTVEVKLSPDEYCAAGGEINCADGIELRGSIRR